MYTQSNQVKDDKMAYYGHNPSKNVVIGFSDKEGIEAFLKYDSKQYGDNQKEEYKRKAINYSEYEQLKTEKQCGYSIASKKYSELITKLVKEIKDKDKDNVYLQFQRKNFNTIGIVANMKKEEYEVLQKNHPEQIKKHTVLLDKTKEKDLNLITTATLNGNIMEYRSKDSKQFMYKIGAIMKPDNFMQLNPDYSKFAAVFTKSVENNKDVKSFPSVFKFPSSKGRDNFVKKMQETIQDSKGAEIVQPIANFNGITTFKVVSKEVIETRNIKKDKGNFIIMLDNYRDSVKYRIEQRKEHQAKNAQQIAPKTQSQSQSVTR